MWSGLATTLFGLCIWATMFVPNTTVVKLGILAGIHVLPCATIFAFSITEVFPDHMDLINALVSSAGDMSFCSTLVVKQAADYASISYRSASLITLGLALLFGIPCFILTPSSWESYNLSRRALINQRDMELWIQIKDKIPDESFSEFWNHKNRGKRRDMLMTTPVNLSYDPDTMPLYFSYTQFYQVLLSPHMIVFGGWLLLHYLRCKKLIVPYISQIIAEKAVYQGIETEEAIRVYNLFQYAPAFGTIANVVFAFLAKAFGQVLSWQIANLMCASLFFVIYMSPWTWMYYGAAVYALHNALMFSLVTAFVGRNYGFRHVQIIIGCTFCVCGLVGFVADATWTRMVTDYFHNSYLSSQIVNCWISIFSIPLLAILASMPFPGPMYPQRQQKSQCQKS
eukprot:GHVH01001541.1.p1 GENE.GHVH01001541.1~~GHVH01001541.1.p1  ORF type:complete len:397 (+),score=20.26 GHVH01001541.1:570-1760(+)